MPRLTWTAALWLSCASTMLSAGRSRRRCRVRTPTSSASHSSTQRTRCASLSSLSPSDTFSMSSRAQRTALLRSRRSRALWWQICPRRAQSAERRLGPLDLHRTRPGERSACTRDFRARREALAAALQACASRPLHSNPPLGRPTSKMAAATTSPGDAGCVDARLELGADAVTGRLRGPSRARECALSTRARVLCGRTATALLCWEAVRER